MPTILVFEGSKLCPKEFTPEYAERLFSWVPEHYRFGCWEHCFYCGQVSECVEHVIPWSFLHVSERYGRKKMSGITTPSCAACNQSLGDIFTSTLAERCFEAQRKIKGKHRKLLRLPFWEPEDMAKLGKNLRNHIRTNEELRQKIIIRLKWQESPEFIRLFEDAYETVKLEFPNNQKLVEFFEPPWMTRSLNLPRISEDGPRESLRIIVQQNSSVAPFRYRQ